ncbi:MAG: hypothetical protein EHM12_08215 [Dehalococcoidia bacterium]|nr:MAG: hypothetical protein EHM12_08215 [Dehalococcoidia bacterium]
MIERFKYFWLWLIWRCIVLFDICKPIIIKILLLLSAITWELPQTIGSLILALIFLGRSRVKFENSYWLVMVNDKRFTGISLGRFVFISDWIFTETVKKHEYGHTWQSLILGWLYLIIVGIPSIIRSQKGFCKSEIEYYSHFPENWADKLGGVVR